MCLHAPGTRVAFLLSVLSFPASLIPAKRHREAFLVRIRGGGYVHALSDCCLLAMATVQEVAAAIASFAEEYGTNVRALVPVGAAARAKMEPDRAVMLAR
jgi:hypothetical protein